MNQTEETGNHYTPEELWKVLHVAQNRSAQAAALAKSETLQLDTQDFSNEEVAQAHGEYARIWAVTALSAAKKSGKWPEAREQLLLAIEAVLMCYPLAGTAEKAQVRGEYWNAVYGEQNAQLAAARDVFELSKVLAGILSEHQVISWMSSLQQVLTELQTQAEGKRELLVSLIKHADYDTALQAFNEYHTEHWIGSEDFSADQAITLYSIHLGRLLDAGAFKEARKVFAYYIQLLVTQKGFSLFGVKELISNISKERKASFLLWRYRTWYTEAWKDQEFLEQVSKLLGQTFLGTGSSVLELPR